MKQRYESLDGLRGIAALSVVFLHYVSAFAPFLIGSVATQRHSGLDYLVSTSPLALPIAGNFAVCIFFVLSGFVLSLKFFRTKDNNVLVSSAARRYFRLMIPAFASILLAYIILRLGLFYSQQAAVGSESTTFLATFWTFPAQIGQAIHQGLYGIWFGVFNVSTSYNFVLWTMHYELYGSFLVFMFLALFGKHPSRYIFYGIFSIIFLKTYFLGFIAGMIICDVYTNYPHLRHKLSPKLVWPSLFVAIGLGTWSIDSIYSGFYNKLSFPFFTPAQLELTAHMIGAILVVIAVLELTALSRFFKTKPLQYLGRTSFSLYLVHPLVLGSVASFIFYRLLPVYGYKVAAVACFVISLPITFVLANLFTKYVDVPSITISKQIGDALLNTGPHRERLSSKFVDVRNYVRTTALFKRLSSYGVNKEAKNEDY